MMTSAGDHKQLRPKVEQYSLRVESGRGFDLNVSLFERLVKSGYPHTTLELQHRMPPEVRRVITLCVDVVNEKLGWYSLSCITNVPWSVAKPWGVRCRKSRKNLWRNMCLYHMLFSPVPALGGCEFYGLNKAYKNRFYPYEYLFRRSLED